MKNVLAVLLTLILLLSCAGAEELTKTSEWTAPDLSNLTENDPFQLHVLAVAQTQVGYQAGKNYANKYSQWFNRTNSAWCTEFVFWCVNEADKNCGTKNLGDVYPKVGTATEAAVFYIKQDRYVSASGLNFDGEPQFLPDAEDYLTRGGYIPQPGDILWLHVYGGRDNPDHSTLVEGVSQDENGQIWVHVIEGNMDSCVRRYTYAIDDVKLFGYGVAETRAYTCIAKESRYGGVNTLRQELNSLGYSAGGSVYRMGSAMVKALKAFQKDQGLPETGKQDIATRKALNEALGK